jgi:hypothetical protein
MERRQTVQYLLEIRDVLWAAVWQFEQVESAARRLLELDVAWLAAEEDEEIEIANVNESIRQQALLFDSLEAFLAAWARLSLLLFPVVGGDSGAPWREQRAAALQRLLEIPELPIIANRDLRDAWMHFDERLDQMISAGKVAGRQRFTRSKDVTDRLKENTLRLIEVDTLKIHYHDRAGTVQTTDLHPLNRALGQLQDRLKTAWSLNRKAAT